jgi:hypothetical protein
MKVCYRPFHIILDSWGRPLGPSLGEGALGHLLMVIESHQGQLPHVFQWKQVQHPAHHQRRRQVHNLLREHLVGARVPREGTHFRDCHRAVHRFNLVLHVGDVEDPITNMIAHSCKHDLCIEKERPRWEEQVATTRFMQQLIITRHNINPWWWSCQVC